MSLTRALQRLSLAAHPRPPALALARSSLASSSRAPAPAHAPQPGSSRAYATEAAHLGNLAPHPGSTKNVRRHLALLVLIALVLNAHSLSPTHSASASGAASVQGEEARLAGVTRARALAAATASLQPTLPAARRPSPAPTPSAASPTRAYLSMRCRARAQLTDLDPPRSNKENLVPLNLERLQHWIDRGLIDPSRPITMRELYETRCVHGVQDGVKLLGDVRISLVAPLLERDLRTDGFVTRRQGAEYLTSPDLHITVSKASQSAIDAVEKLGGTLIARYENRLTLVRCPLPSLVPASAGSNLALRASSTMRWLTPPSDCAARPDPPRVVLPQGPPSTRQGRPRLAPRPPVLLGHEAPRLPRDRGRRGPECARGTGGGAGGRGGAGGAAAGGAAAGAGVERFGVRYRLVATRIFFLSSSRSAHPGPPEEHDCQGAGCTTARMLYVR